MLLQHKIILILLIIATIGAAHASITNKPTDKFKYFWYTIPALLAIFIMIWF